MPHYRRRAIEATFAERASHRVAILEGRRAVGKSSLARHLVESGVYASYQSLTDPAAAGRAQEDAFQWVRSLRRPAVIDEAQMVPAVSVAVKEIVDGLPPGHHFLLTGSASVGRGTMARTDPLAGRATRLALHPFTGLEAQGPSDSETPTSPPPGRRRPGPTTCGPGSRPGGFPPSHSPSCPSRAPPGRTGCRRTPWPFSETGCCPRRT